MDCWRLLDTKPCPAAENTALDDALLEARSLDLIPNTVRFLQYKPNAVLIGYHQTVEQEVRLEYCKTNNVDINRRITGGGAIYFDETQLGWEVIASRDDFSCSIEKLYERMCEPVTIGLRRLGVDAEFRSRNDIEVDGRKISGTGGTQRGKAFLFQGTLLVDFDVESMLKSLRIPVKKLSDKEIDSVKERVTCLKEVLGYTPKLNEIKTALVEGFRESFGVELADGGLNHHEKKLLPGFLEKTESRQWVYGRRRPQPKHSVLYALRKTPGGLVRASLVVYGNRIQSALITGDFFVFPSRAILDLEAILKDSKATSESVEKVVNQFYVKNRPEIPGVSAIELTKVITEALETRELEKYGLSTEEANDVFTVGGKFSEILDTRPSLLLIPYCSKLYDCRFRQQEDCVRCGRCSAGRIYELADKLGMESTGICSFEHLMETLRKHKETGRASYIGFCCEAFYSKHQDELEDAGMKGILVDIEGETCYDLGLEKEAYRGEYKNQTELKTELIEKIISLYNPVSEPLVS